jgi:cyclic pyranopterin phosphate synthase
MMTFLTDSQKRPISYMRVSVTDRCNLRCRYCTPTTEFSSMSHGQVIRYEEIVRLVSLLTPRGIRSVRITGGEPLVRKHLDGLITDLKQIEDIEDISLTTNGLLLAKQAATLADAGLCRVNVSLDTLNPERFRWITDPDGSQGAELDQVMEGLAAAQSAGLTPVKVNAVLMRGFNDDEIEDFARLAEDTDYEVRFIEFMPMGPNGYWGKDKVVSAGEAIGRLETVFGKLEELGKGRGAGPAKRYRIPGHKGTIGFITPISHEFCVGCNRIRITSDGKLRTCLFSDLEADILTPMRDGASNEELLNIVEKAISKKPDGHEISKSEVIRTCTRTMSHIGG